MARVLTHTPGFPRIGARRELPRALGALARGEIDAAALAHSARQLRARHWAMQAAAGLDFVTVGDFSLADQMADHGALFGCAPSSSTRRWFDTNSYYTVPALSAATRFSLHAEHLLAQVEEARALQHKVKVALIGPLTFLWLAASDDDRLALLDELLPVYCALLASLKDAGAAWIQLDEPILGLDLAPQWRNAFEPCYWRLGQVGAQLMLATYFSPLEENLSLACRLPVAGLHVDGVSARQELVSVCDWLPVPKVLSIGIVDGRNVWRTDLDQAICTIEPLLARRGGEIWLAPSCSLQHVPLTLDGEDGIDPEVRAWLAFAAEKLGELATLKAALSCGGAQEQLAQSRAGIAARARSGKVYKEAVAHAITSLAPDQQRGLPALDDSRRAHAFDDDGLCEQFDGVAVTRGGWVQAHGAQCVKPVIIYGDVARARTPARMPGAASLTGPATIVQCAFVREDQPRALTALQVALALREHVRELASAGIAGIRISEPALREGLPLRRARRDDYLAWATRALHVALETGHSIATRNILPNPPHVPFFKVECTSSAPIGRR